jgi:hypothetical protein
MHKTLVVTGLLGLGAMGSSPVPTTLRPFAFAPYAFMVPGADVMAWAKDTGQRYVTLAFYNSVNGRCEGAWPQDEAAVLAQARGLQALGGGVIVSSGGWNGDDLAAHCADPKALADVYDGVLSRFGANHLDLDAEPGDAHDNLVPQLVDRRSAAMRILQDRFAARGRRLHVSFTLAVRPAFGMDERNFYVLKSAKAAGVDIDVINPMIMDYGDNASAGQMGARSIQALQFTEAQLKSLLPGREDAAYWSMIAATPMLGQNDVEPEVFTLDDARRLESFAEAKGMARLTFWSLARDNGGCAGQQAPHPNCSGIAQGPWAFSRIIGRFAQKVR